MPWILWRYTFVELWRVVLICTVILVAVIAFAATVKPLAEGALTPLGAIRFMLLAIPPMLAYALPFAAGFGATLAYHRMAQDNETVAAHSGGVSHLAVLVPAIASGLIFAGGMVALNEQVIPRFLRSMERMITLDVAQLVVRRIERGQSAQLESFTIYSEKIHELDPPEDMPLVDQLFLLENGAAIETADDGEVLTDATFGRAWIALGEDPTARARMVCRIGLADGVGYTVGDGLKVIDRANFRPIPIPDAFDDDPKFLTHDELRALRDNPDAMYFVEQRRMRLAERLAMRRMDELLERELGGIGRVALLGRGGQRVEMSADEATRAGGGDWLLEPAGGPVTVRRFEVDDDGATRVYTETADEAWLRLEGRDGDQGIWEAAEAADSLRFTLQLLGVRTESDRGTVTERPSRELRGLRLMDDPMAYYASMESGALLVEAARARADGGAGPGIARAAEELRDRIAKLQREITSKQHERMAMAASCFVMVLLGAIMALRHREKLPLVVYLWSFLPALAMILLISSGQQHTHNREVATGLPILWSGVAAVGGVAVVSFAKLARH